MSRRRWRRLVLTSAMAIAIAGALAQGASAAVVGIERVGAVSATNSVNKSATVSCPAGKKVLSASADVTPGDGDVLIDDVRPNADLQSVTVNALEDETGTTADWAVTAIAICAYPPPGLERVSATSPLNSQNKSVTATCPSGKRVLGTGADLNTFVGPGAARRPATRRRAHERDRERARGRDRQLDELERHRLRGLLRARPGADAGVRRSPLDSTSNRVVRARLPRRQAADGSRRRHQHVQRTDGAGRDASRSSTRAARGSLRSRTTRATPRTGA